MLIPYFLLWLLYVMVTTNERLQYAKAKEKGMDCYSSKDASVFFYGSVTEFKYDPTSPPIRRFLTWREYWKIKGYCR